MFKNTVKIFQNPSFFLRCFSTNGSLQKLAYYQHVGKTPLIYENIGQQFEKSVQKFSKHVAVKSWYDQRQLTYEELYDEASVMAVRLQELGLARGQHLAIWAPNTAQWVVTYIAAAMAGYPLVCINPALQCPELKYALEKSKTKTIITMDNYGKLDFLTILRQVVGSDSTVIVKTEQMTDDFINYDQWLKTKPSSHKICDIRNQIDEIQPESPFLLQFTSGTTGKPKCALISHYNMVNEAVYMGIALSLSQIPKSICFNVPMFHAFGLAVMAAALKNGCTLCIPSPTFNAKACLDAIESDKCNVMVGTPTMYVDLMDQQTKLNKNVCSMELALVGGSACSPQVVHRLKKTFKNANISLGYGLSEATAAVSATDESESPEDAILSCGRLCAHGEAKIIDENGKTVKFGEVGELCLRGWFTMMGYFEDEESTKKIIDTNGWLKTGDKFIMRPNGIGCYQGREKDILIRGGENIFPKEIEDVIGEHPCVLESQVIGVPDERLGEEVCVFLRLKPEAAPLTQDDIKEFCQGKLAYFKIPKYVQILDEFPKTTSGKIQKFKLQEMFKAKVK